MKALTLTMCFALIALTWAACSTDSDSGGSGGSAGTAGGGGSGGVSEAGSDAPADVDLDAPDLSGIDPAKCPSYSAEDPHARHTTTNLRNVARFMFRHGIPTDKPSLITTDLFQTAYISAAGPDSIYGKRCLEELGFMPYQGLTNLDTLDNCWLPSVNSMQQDARDLLDP